MEKNLFFGSRYLLTLPSKIKSGNCDKATKNVTIINLVSIVNLFYYLFKLALILLIYFM